MMEIIKVCSPFSISTEICLFSLVCRLAVPLALQVLRFPSRSQVACSCCGAGLETMLEEGDDAEDGEGGEEEDAEFVVSASEAGEMTVKKVEKACIE